MVWLELTLKSSGNYPGSPIVVNMDNILCMQGTGKEGGGGTVLVYGPESDTDYGFITVHESMPEILELMTPHAQ